MLERSKSGLLLAGGLDYPAVSDLQVGDEVAYMAFRGRGYTVRCIGKITSLRFGVGLAGVTIFDTDAGDCAVLAQSLLEVRALWNGEPRWVGIPDPS